MRDARFRHLRADVGSASEACSKSAASWPSSGTNPTRPIEANGTPLPPSARLPPLPNATMLSSGARMSASALIAPSCAADLPKKVGSSRPVTRVACTVTKSIGGSRDGSNCARPAASRHLRSLTPSPAIFLPLVELITSVQPAGRSTRRAAAPPPRGADPRDRCASGRPAPPVRPHRSGRRADLAARQV